MRLDKSFYIRPATELAPCLVGKLLCRQKGGQVIRARITETECYFGQEDTACHAHHGKTSRTAVLYEEGGIAYIYLCYGLHYLLNVVTGPAGHPEAVLLRGVEGFAGPAKLTKAFGIDKTLNGEDFCTSAQLWIEDDGTSFTVEKSKRIGIGYASELDQNRLWRYTIKTKQADQ